ncbi:hypothetical protein FLONG3_4571 [Fusarium longipes]|uniref:Uncharacterized protein n=1 Tax=Fusarium longipes TaxID=694270 RepID=A0A395SYR0_9HYPO|nr:hypothetical protein FLONG3_4571 [Fusarium longipes]
MDLRDNVPGRQGRTTRGNQAALETKSPEHVNHDPRSGDLIDSSSTGCTQGRQNAALMQDNETRMNSASIKEFLALQEAQMNSFLQHAEERVDAQGSSMKQITDQLGGIATSIGSALAHWLRHSTTQQEALLREELAHARNQYTDIRGRYQRVKVKNRALQMELQEANTKLAEAVEKQNELQKIADTSNWTGAVKVSDDAIRSKWKQLDYNVRAMAGALAKCQTKRPTDEVNKARFESITPAGPNLLDNDDYKELIITAYLWVLVDQEIFQNGNKFWGGGFIQGLKNIRKHLVGIAPESDRPSRSGPTMRHVAKWTAQGTGLLIHFHGRDRKAPSKLASNALDRLEDVCNIAADVSGTDFLQEMKSIMENALDIDEMLMGSMAIFSILWPSTGKQKNLRYDADGMEVVAHTGELSPNTAVAFIISPLLLKMGNADGRNYDSEMILCKASVVCV